MPSKPQLTHFLCIPLVTPSSRPSLQTSISRFTNEVTAPHTTLSIPIPIKAVRPAGTIHFTLGVMSLLSPERVEAVCSFLRNMDVLDLLRQAEAGISASETDLERTIGDNLKFTLSGLHAMQTPSKTSSLYLSPSNPSSVLLPFCRTLTSAFHTSGFLLPDPRPLKLHATIVNTIYAREAKSGKKRWSKDSRKIDAREVIERYEGYEWVKDMKIDRVAICEMGAKKVVEGEEVVDQVYTEVVSVPLP